MKWFFRKKKGETIYIKPPTPIEKKVTFVMKNGTTLETHGYDWQRLLNCDFNRKLVINNEEDDSLIKMVINSDDVSLIKIEDIKAEKE